MTGLVAPLPSRASSAPAPRYCFPLAAGPSQTFSSGTSCFSPASASRRPVQACPPRSMPRASSWRTAWSSESAQRLTPDPSAPHHAPPWQGPVRPPALPCRALSPATFQVEPAREVECAGAGKQAGTGTGLALSATFLHVNLDPDLDHGPFPALGFREIRARGPPPWSCFGEAPRHAVWPFPRGPSSAARAQPSAQEYQGAGIEQGPGSGSLPGVLLRGTGGSELGGSLVYPRFCP